MKNVYIENKSLSEYCSNAFGSVFKKAYLEVTVYENPAAGYEPENLIENAKRLDFSEGDYDTQTVVVEFSNGAVVRFINSEWASFKKIELETLNMLDQLGK